MSPEGLLLVPGPPHTLSPALRRFVVQCEAAWIQVRTSEPEAVMLCWKRPPGGDGAPSAAEGVQVPRSRDHE